jgi:probable HAF family extracellular repeat protein
LLGLASPAAQAALPEYQLTDLGTLGGIVSQAFNINGNGQVVGLSNIRGDMVMHAFLWTSEGGMQDLGTLGGVDVDSEARAINDNGQVVGASDFPGGRDYEKHAFLWTSGEGMRDLGALGGAESIAYDISPDGQVVGNAGTKNSRFHAFHWKDGVMRDIDSDPTSGTQSIANGINARGQIVGSDPVGILWTPGEEKRNLGGLGGPSGPESINDNGQVVGSSFTTSDWDSRSWHAFLWTPDEGMRDLGYLEDFGRSVAYDINNNGQVVGNSFPDDDLLVRAFLWTAVEGMQDLNEAPGVKDSGWTLARASAINDAGQIAGWGKNPDGETHAFLLTPVQLKCQGRLPTVIGGAGNDVLKGTAGKDVIQGRGGNDTIRASGGNDIVCGGAGNDKLYGGAGKNKLSGGAGKDTCKQGAKRSGCER